jgi:hypothetical protein
MVDRLKSLPQDGEIRRGFFRAVIKKITTDGSGCVVELLEPVADKKLVVVSPETAGSLSLFNAWGSCFKKGSRVTILAMRVQGSALKALEIA